VLWRVVDATHNMSDEVEAVGIDYGQRHIKELNAAVQMCQMIGVPYSRIVVPNDLLAGAMLTSDKPIPEQSYSDLPVGMSPTYVPFRNGLMLSLLAAKAQKWVMEDRGARRKASIYIGSHAEDAENDAYPDCSVDFMQSMAKVIDIGTYGMVKLVRPLIAMKKADVIRYGQGVGVPWNMTWSCYKGEDVHCGKCMTCRARQDGFKAAGVDDPTKYEAAPVIMGHGDGQGRYA
jgi:7-cyano-7-deazaguanine synthase